MNPTHTRKTHVKRLGQSSRGHASTKIANTKICNENHFLLSIHLFAITYLVKFVNWSLGPLGLGLKLLRCVIQVHVCFANFQWPKARCPWTIRLIRQPHLVVTQSKNHRFNLMVTLAMFGSINYNMDAASSGNSKVGAKVATIEISCNLQNM